MLTDSERHVAQGLQAQLDYLTQLDRAREDAAWNTLLRRTEARLAELRHTDPDTYALLMIEIPVTEPPRGRGRPRKIRS